MELIREPRDGDVLDATTTMYPCRIEIVAKARRAGSATSTAYGFVARGEARLAAPGLDVRAEAGAFFAAPGGLEIDPAPSACVVVMERHGFRGLLQVGRIEERGRLSYIDGCSDTVLVGPPRLGDPVLNHLHFPPGIRQTLHLHPSVRLGVVARGEGMAFGPARAGGGPWEERLLPGAVFLLNAHEIHAFRTTESATAMDVIAFHPDSDWGPTDLVHPMLNRTYLEPSDRTARAHK